MFELILVSESGEKFVITLSVKILPHLSALLHILLSYSSRPTRTQQPCTVYH